jgi:tyrosyl-tRNA synthetase
MTTLTLLQELRERGLVEQIANEAELARALESGAIAAYCGFDPTAMSLHVGNLVPVMILAHLQRRGHRPIAIVGGATGMIGDPSGKDTERQLLGNEQIEANCNAIRTQLARFVRFDAGGALLLNNHDWIGRFSYIDWLREVGKYFTVNYMIAKESVKRRLEAREQGISYTEFSYMMLQAYDFLHLYEQHHCLLQIGGSDQWGNITAGIDLVHKKCGASVFGLTTPLITTASGEKFGKSAGNAVFLDASMTSPYKFYQYWMAADDRDVARWLKLFTFIDLAEIEQIAADHAAAPHKRTGQRRVAEEMTRLVHGDEGLRRAQRATEILFGGTIDNIDDAEVAEIFGDVPSSTVSRAELEAGIPILDLVAATMTLATSKGEARRLVQQGGLSLNNVRVSDEKLVVTAANLASSAALVLRAGKAKYHVVRFA